MADFVLLKSPTLISRKIWMIEKSWNFHSVKYVHRLQFFNLKSPFQKPNTYFEHCTKWIPVRGNKGVHMRMGLSPHVTLSQTCSLITSIEASVCCGMPRHVHGGGIHWAIIFKKQKCKQTADWNVNKLKYLGTRLPRFGGAWLGSPGLLLNRHYTNC